MTDKLETFIDDHIREFNTVEPASDLWSKIDAQMEIKNPARISSNWLSKFKYLGFGACVLVLAVYFIAKNMYNSSENERVQERKDSAMAHPGQQLKAFQNTPGSENNKTQESNDLSANKNKLQDPAPASRDNTEQQVRSAHDKLLNTKENPDLNAEPFETTVPGEEKINSEASVFPGETGNATANAANEKKENNLAKSSKKAKLYIPEEPVEMNTYTGTLYEGSSFRPMLRAYKFPGKFNLDDGGYRSNVKTISCIRLEKEPNIKAVWLKGRTDKKIVLSIKKRFKNIVLVKRDGRKLNPEAISHYYRGLGVISEYSGRHFNILYTDKVELILFFKDAEEGDRVIIDGTIESVVRGKP